MNTTQTKHTALPYEISHDGKILGPREGCSNVIICEMPVWFSEQRNKGHATQDRQEANAAFIVRACNSHYELLKACKDLYGLIQDGVLVRDTSKDAESNWSMKAISLVQKLAKAEAAIALAERGEQE